jgi:predicted phosphodiesterase
VAASILLGVVLTLGTSDGRSLQLTVSLAKSSTCALVWDGSTITATSARTLHVFRPLSLPRGAPVAYELRLPNEASHTVDVRALARGADRLTIALYGDTRGGDAAHRLLVKAIADHEPDLVVHTGDVVRSANDEAGWMRHLAVALPISERVPTLFALGNHEIFELEGAGAIREQALARAMTAIPPPVDPLTLETGASRAAFHVRIGPALFISLDSNVGLGASSSDHRFLERALMSRDDARFVFVMMHHGPLSSGPHGPHDDATDLIELFEKYHVTAVLAGHDHTYERIVRNGITYVVSGGGGAPLYPRSRSTVGSMAFASTYNWALITIDGERVDLEAMSLEGAVLDRASIAPAPHEDVRQAPVVGMTRLVAAVAILLAGLLYAGQRLSRR